jgi:hypothetical protein
MNLNFRDGRNVAWQAMLVIVAWMYMCGLQTENDGLWFQPDSSRHALNGLFWRDFLTALPVSPQAYAQGYFARYPAINPVTYPPFFYLIEGAMFAAFGPSPFLAKGIVLGFTLAGALYALAWLRRWVCAPAGYLAAAVPLLPVVVEWSHAIMLNVPACVLTWAGLYHTRRWIEEPKSRHLYAAAVFSTLAVLTYYQSAVVVPVIVAWLVVSGRARLMIAPRTLATAAVCGAVLLPSLIVAIRWAPMHVQMTTPGPPGQVTISYFLAWLYYPLSAPELFGPPLIALATAGAVAGMRMKSGRWRFETKMLLVWVIVTYVCLTNLKARDPRYLMPLVVALVLLSAIGLAALAGVVIAGSRSRRAGTAAVLAGATSLFLGLGWQAWHMPAVAQFGLREVAELLGSIAPDEPVFYDGYNHGAFIFHVRAADPDMRRMVVRGDKLLYVIPLNGMFKAHDIARSPREVVEILRTRAGCRFLAIEQGNTDPPSPAYAFLREAVRGPLFRRVATVPIVRASASKRIDIFEMLGSIDRPAEIDVPVPIWGQDARLKARPIPARASSQPSVHRQALVPHLRARTSHEPAPTHVLDRDPDV